MAARKKSVAATTPEAAAQANAAPAKAALAPHLVLSPARPGSPYLGTSGFDYDPWVGPFYPPELKRKDRLSFYGAHFGSIEINASFYRKPSVENVQAWCAQVPPAFRFVLKGWNRVTHQKRLHDCGDLVNAFALPVRALGDRMGPVLWQLPPNLKRDAALLRDFLAVLPKDLHAAFEFRNESWFDEEVFTLMRDAGAALCIADSEERKTPLVVTAPFGYFRLRREDYDEPALQSWADKIREAKFAGDVFVFFKHEDSARGPDYATQFERLVTL